MSRNPAVILYDASGNALAVQDGVAIPANTPGVIALGSDGTNARYVRTATDGTLRTDPTGTTTQPVSASSLPLPTGAATEATLASLAGEDFATQATLATLATEATLAGLAAEDFATETTLSTADGRLTTIDAVLDSIKDTDGIKKITDPLPAGTNVLGRVDLYDSEHDKTAQFTAFGLLKTAQESIIGDYRYDADSIPDQLDVTTTGSGSYSIEAGGTGVRLKTGAAASSSCKFVSKRTHPYLSGRGITYKFSTILGDTGVAGNIREWGAYDGTDGALLRMSGTTLQFVVSRGGVETVIDASAWDVPVTITANGHLWYIQYEWLGVGNIYLWHNEEIVHTYAFIGTSIEFSMGTPDLPLWLLNENTANTSDVYLKTGCSSVVMEGGTVISGVDNQGSVRQMSVNAEGSVNVTVVGSVPPDGVAGVEIAADTPLSVGTHDTSYTIPSGETFFIQQFECGNEDPAKGAKIEVIFDDGTEHIVARAYTNGETISVPLPNLGVARDGTALAGNGSNTLIIRRSKYSGSNIEIDAVVRGYAQ